MYKVQRAQYLILNISWILIDYDLHITVCSNTDKDKEINFSISEEYSAIEQENKK